MAELLLDERNGYLIVKTQSRADRPWRPLSIREEGLLFALMETKEGRSTVASNGKGR